MGSERRYPWIAPKPPPSALSESRTVPFPGVPGSMLTKLNVALLVPKVYGLNIVMSQIQKAMKLELSAKLAKKDEYFEELLKEKLPLQ